MPNEMGPGAYTVTQKAYEIMGRKRVDVGIQKIQYPVYGGKETGKFGFVYVGDQLCFDKDIYERHQKLESYVEKKRQKSASRSNVFTSPTGSIIHDNPIATIESILNNTLKNMKRPCTRIR